MTAEEHKRRFGKTIEVHRTSYGPYRERLAVALCNLCHQAKHSFKAAIRKRDGYVCTECGMTNKEHHQVYEAPLDVHCVRTICIPKNDYPCSEVAWRQLKVKAEECFTLCVFCHVGKHRIGPTILRRDNFQCTECGKRPADKRDWHTVLSVHRLCGDCEDRWESNEVDPFAPDADPSGFVTLCDECHERRHPDRLAEALALGGTVELPKVVADHGAELGISLPITGKEQLAPYKTYLLLVNSFIAHFRQHGIPKQARLSRKLVAGPESPLSMLLRQKAAEQAIAEVSRNEFYETMKKRKAFAKMNDAEKAAYVQEQKDRHLDYVILNQP
jgi:hypothetical protein